MPDQGDKSTGGCAMTPPLFTHWRDCATDAVHCLLDTEGPSYKLARVQRPGESAVALTYVGLEEFRLRFEEAR